MVLAQQEKIDMSKDMQDILYDYEHCKDIAECAFCKAFENIDSKDCTFCELLRTHDSKLLEKIEVAFSS